MHRSLPRRRVPGIEYDIGAALHDHRTTGIDRLGPAALATAGVGVAAVAARSASLWLPCPFLELTGVPCPACGMTRLADALAHGHVADAAATDPAGLVFVLLVGGLAVAYVLARVIPAVGRITIGPRAVRQMLLGSLAVHWATTMLTGGFVSG